MLTFGLLIFPAVVVKVMTPLEVIKAVLGSTVFNKMFAGITVAELWYIPTYLHS